MEARQKKSKKKLLVVVLVLVLVLALAVYLYRGGGGPEPVAKTAEVLAPAVTIVPQPREAVSPSVVEVDVCTASREKLQGLFAYLDRQDYVASRKLKGGSAGHFKRLLDRLLATPPAVQRETDDLLRVLQNRAHFFRVLGKNDTLLVRDILRKEGDMVEASFAILYQALVLQEKCKAGGPMVKAPLEKVYPYALFFLDTLGGTSYLMRQESRVRLLARYYAVLVIDQANQRKVNRLGFDIRPSLAILARDVEGAANLARKEEYLQILKSVRARY
jgi:hypothetical protein